jgi:hypothetical protein
MPPPGRHRRSGCCPGARGYKSIASLFVLEAVELANALGTAATRWMCSLAALPSPPYDNHYGT